MQCYSKILKGGFVIREKPFEEKCASPQFCIICKVTVAGYGCSRNSFLML